MARPAFRCGRVASYSKTVAPACECIHGKSSARAWHGLKAPALHPHSRQKESLNGAELVESSRGILLVGRGGEERDRDGSVLKMEFRCSVQVNTH